MDPSGYLNRRICGIGVHEELRRERSCGPRLARRVHVVLAMKAGWPRRRTEPRKRSTGRVAGIDVRATAGAVVVVVPDDLEVVREVFDPIGGALGGRAARTRGRPPGLERLAPDSASGPILIPAVPAGMPRCPGCWGLAVIRPCGPTLI